MAKKPTVVEYKADLPKAVKTIAAVVARLGYTLGSADRENGIVTFETGMSMSSWAGQAMSAQVLDMDEETVQVTIGGAGKAHGDQLQIYDWGESGKIASKVFAELDKILGEGKTISGDKESGGCFVATAVYGSYDHPSVLVLREFRDHRLSESTLGRAFIRIYYRLSPPFAFYVGRRPLLRSLARNMLEFIISMITPKN